MARLAAIKMLLAFACFKDFKLFQIDVKSAFLYGFISEEIYVEQPPGFQNDNLLNHVFKLSRVLHGLKQALKAWYQRLSKFLIDNGFSKEKIDTTLFTKTRDDELFIVQIYVDNIVFCTTNESLYQEFSKCMQGELKIYKSTYQAYELDRRAELFPQITNQTNE